MKHADLFQLLSTLQIPVAYDHFVSDKNVMPLLKEEVATVRLTERFLRFNKTFSRHPLEPRGLLLCSGGGKVSKTPLF